MPNLYMPVDRETIALEAAKMLLEIKAVHFYKDKPFIFTSGWASPVYIDCRKIISYPRLRSTLIDFAATTIVRTVNAGSSPRPRRRKDIVPATTARIIRKMTSERFFSAHSDRLGPITTASRAAAPSGRGAAPARRR